MTQTTQITPKGYKQTEIGVIPADWDVKKLGKACEKITTGKLDANAMKKDGEYRFYTCAKEYYFIDKYSFDTEALLVSGNGANVGYIHYYKGKFNAYQRTYVLSDFKENIFFTKLLLDKNLKERIRTEVNAGNTPYITMGTLTEMNIAYPADPTEQTAIATVLSDTEALIKKLEKLIAKKKAIKQGAMQQLLTGKKRLTGFSGEWEVKKLGEIFRLSATSSKSKFIFDNGKYLIMDMGSVSSEGKVIASKKTNVITDLLTKGDLVMPKDDIGGGNIIGKVGFIDRDNNYILGDHVYKLSLIKVGFDSLFLSFLINNHNVNSELKKKVAGSAQLGLGRKSVEEQEIKLPKDTEEQTAIATVLSDMDSEIEKMENKLGKYRQIKTGMMQQLLTGKIRLLKN